MRGRHAGTADSSVEAAPQQREFDPSDTPADAVSPARPQIRRNSQQSGDPQRAIPAEGRHERQSHQRVSKRRFRIADGIVRDRIQARLGRGDEADCGSREVPHRISESSGRKRPRWSSAPAMTSPSAANATAEGTVKNASRFKRGVDARSECRCCVARGNGGERRQFRGRYRDAEQADRQRVEERCVGEPADRAVRKKTRDVCVDVGGDLHGAPADEHREEVADRAPHRLRHRDGAAAGQAECDWRLDEELQARSGDRSPPQHHGELVELAAQAHTEAAEQRPDHGGVPGDARRIREQELAVAVQHAETPGGGDEHARGWKDDPDETDRERTLRSGEPGGDRVDEERRREHAEEHQHRHDEHQQREDRARQLGRVVVAPLRAQPGVDRDERTRKRPFAEQVLEQIRDSERRVERVGLFRGGLAEEIRERDGADETRQPAGQYARSDHRIGADESPERPCRYRHGVTDARSDDRYSRPAMQTRRARRPTASNPASAAARACPCSCGGCVRHSRRIPGRR